jgi:hypothetical protein
MVYPLALMVVVASALTATTCALAPPFVQVTSAEKTLNQSGDRWANTNGEVHGRLAYLRLDIVCDESDPKAVRKALASALGLNFVDHFPHATPTGGTDPPLNLSLRDVGAVEALETIVAASSLTQSGTWQVRDGILEVGPKSILARRTPTLTRVYNVTDLLLEPPRFSSQDRSRGVLLAGGSPEPPSRQTPREIAANLMESIVTTISPEVWHPATPSEIEDGYAPTIDPRDPTNGFNLDPRARHPVTGSLLPLKVSGKWASIVYKNKAIIVRGPAFVHLGIAGLPRPVPPPSSIVGATSR